MPSKKDRKMQEISQAAAVARSTLHKKLRLYRTAAAAQPSRINTSDINQQKSSLSNSQYSIAVDSETTTATSVESIAIGKQTPPGARPIHPKVGDIVHVPSLKKKATVLRVEASKGDVVVQSGIMKMKLKVVDIVI